MTHGLPIVRLAVHDTTLPDLALRVLLVLTEQLDPMEYRPVKHEVLAHVLRRRRQSIGFAMRELEQRHYLRAGIHDPLAPDCARSERPVWYRLPWSAEADGHRPPWAQKVA